ncbi:MAG: alpha/beta fold hydrolase [Mucinivorans sp.]
MDYKEYSGHALKEFRSHTPFITESGARLESVLLAYHTYGTLNAERDNVIWVCHALTANSDVADWWPGTVVEGGLLDPKRWFVVCANKLGSCYGSSSPLNTPNCPEFTIRDNVRAFTLLAAELGINQVRLMIGGSTGGMQAMEWAIMEPERIKNLALVATFAQISPWIVANSHTQRMMIRATGNLEAARALSLLFYRNSSTYNSTQTTQSVGSYQEYQGKKLQIRYDTECYLRMLYTLDSHDVSRGRGSLAQALGQIQSRTICVSIDSDILFEAKYIEQYAALIPEAKYMEIHSDYGHDGFLIETPLITKILMPLLEA